ncbi:hypothetical protein [Vibrio cholerae]|uniref:hypothetical protein n=1 Tax=Vibrio cholerae TaxID=666 RepID=UPI0030809420
MKKYAIAIAIIIGSLIIGYQIHQSGLPESVKLETLQREHVEEMNKLSDQEKFEHDFYVRLPSTPYSELELGDKIVKGYIEYAEGISGLYITFVIVSLIALVLLQKEKVPLRKHFHIKAIPLLFVSLIFLCVFSFATHGFFVAFINFTLSIGYKAIGGMFVYGQQLITFPLVMIMSVQSVVFFLSKLEQRKLTLDYL